MRRRVTLDVGDQRRWPASILITKVDRQVTKDNAGKKDRPTGGGGGGGAGGSGAVAGTIAIDWLSSVTVVFTLLAPVFPATVIPGVFFRAGISGFSGENRWVNGGVGIAGFGHPYALYLVSGDGLGNLVVGDDITPIVGDQIVLTLGASDSIASAQVGSSRITTPITVPWPYFGQNGSPTKDFTGIAIGGRVRVESVEVDGHTLDNFSRVVDTEWGVASGADLVWYEENTSGPPSPAIWSVNGDAGLFEATGTSLQRTEATLDLNSFGVRPGSEGSGAVAYYGQPYGAVFVATADGFTSQWTLPYPTSYVTGSLNVTVNGIAQVVRNIDPVNGVFALNFTPASGADIYATWTVPNIDQIPPVVDLSPQGVPTIPGAYGTVFRKVFTDGTLAPFQILTYPDAHIGQPGQYMTVFNRFSNGASLTSVHNGYLDLRAVRQPSGSLWNAAFVGTSFNGNDTAHTWGYGIFRWWARFNVGPGTWQSGWLYDTTNWSAIEIDWPEMLESRNLAGHVIGPGAGSDNGNTIPSDIATAFHCFKIERRSTFVAFSIDEVEVGRVTNSMPSDPLAILLDSKVGFPWTGSTGQITTATPNPAFFHVAAVTVDP